MGERAMPTWDDLNILTASFTKLKMLIPYKGGFSKQFMRKLANNTGFNYHNAPLLINDASFTALNQTKTFDSSRDYRDVVIALMYSTDITSRGDLTASGTWHFDPDQAGTSGLVYNVSFQKVTTSFVTLAHTAPAVPVFDVAAESSGDGVQLKLTYDPSPNTQYISGILWRLNSDLIDSGT